MLQVYIPSFFLKYDFNMHKIIYARKRKEASSKEFYKLSDYNKTVNVLSL